MKTNNGKARKVKAPSRKHEILTWAESHRFTYMSDKAVLLSLARRANAEGQCFPSHAALALDIGGSVDTVQRALKRLMAGGLVTRLLRNGKGGHRTSNLYTLTCSPKPHDAVQAKAAPKPHDAGEHYVELQEKKEAWEGRKILSGSEVKEEDRGEDTHEHTPPPTPARPPAPAREHARAPVPVSACLDDWPIDWPVSWDIAPPAWMNRAACEVAT